MINPTTNEARAACDKALAGLHEALESVRKAMAAFSRAPVTAVARDKALAALNEALAARDEASRAYGKAWAALGDAESQRGLLFPYSVGLANVSGSVMGRFETAQEASEFIETLPDHEDGRYYLDGPPDDDVGEGGQ